jgi:hypothetical protein
MRSMYRTTLLALAAMCALGAVAVGSAYAALPEFAKETGFVGHFGKTTFETTGKATWTYTSGLFEGTPSSKTTVTNLTIVFSGGGTFACTNAKAGELVLKGLTGRLGYVNKAKKEVGLMLEAAKPPTKCKFAGASERELIGTIVIPITPLNTKTSKFSLRAEQLNGVQRPLAFEGETANPFAWRTEPSGIAEELGIEAAGELTTNQENEIKG